MHVLCLLCIQQLESLLPPRPAPEEVSPDAEEVDLMEYDAAHQSGSNGRRGEAYDGGSDEEGGAGGPRVQCAQQ